ncbi:MAG: hypothetical protein HW401_661 [Parcubacteria group bacterium]|nr:hypothetical protein [Parcubacteria group bacterium]
MMRYYRRFIFNRFDRLVDKLDDKTDSYGSLVKLGKATGVEERCLKVYIKAMTVLKQRYFYYKKIVSDNIKYSPEMRTEATYKSRAAAALRACHIRGREIKEDFNNLITIEIPWRYKGDLETLFELQEKKKEEKIEFMRQCLDITVSSRHTFESIQNGTVSDCEMLGFCVCMEHDIPPYLYGCMGKGKDILMLDEEERGKMWDEALEKTGEFISSLL